MNRLYGATALEINEDLIAIYGYLPPIRRNQPGRHHRRPRRQPQLLPPRQPTILDNAVYGPLLMQRLDGFAIVIHSISRKIQYVSVNIERHTQYTIAEMINMPLDYFLHPNSIPEFLIAQELVRMSNGKDKHKVDIRMRIGWEQYEVMDVILILVGESIVCSVERMGNNLLLRDPEIQEFAVIINKEGVISTIESSGVAEPFSSYLNEGLLGVKVKDLCIEEDVEVFENFIEDVIREKEGELEELTWILNREFSITMMAVAKYFGGGICGNDFVTSVFTITGFKE